MSNLDFYDALSVRFEMFNEIEIYGCMFNV